MSTHVTVVSRDENFTSSVGAATSRQAVRYTARRTRQWHRSSRTVCRCMCREKPRRHLRPASAKCGGQQQCKYAGRFEQLCAALDNATQSACAENPAPAPARAAPVATPHRARLIFSPQSHSFAAGRLCGRTHGGLHDNVKTVAATSAKCAKSKGQCTPDRTGCVAASAREVSCAGRKFFASARVGVVRSPNKSSCACCSKSRRSSEWHYPSSYLGQRPFAFLVVCLGQRTFPVAGARAYRWRGVRARADSDAIAVPALRCRPTNVVIEVGQRRNTQRMCFRTLDDDRSHSPARIATPPLVAIDTEHGALIPPSHSVRGRTSPEACRSAETFRAYAPGTRPSHRLIDMRSDSVSWPGRRYQSLYSQEWLRARVVDCKLHGDVACERSRLAGSRWP